jgi:SAM-dependent methyltransferase
MSWIYGAENRNEMLVQEKVFWKNRFKEYKSGNYSDKSFYNRLNKDLRVNECPWFITEIVKTYVNILGRKLKTLELAPGPLSTLAYLVDIGLIEITAIDPLADFYNNLFSEYSVDYPIVPIVGFGESLTSVEEYDFTYIQNGLDHTENPKRVFENMYRATKENGIIGTVHFVKDGTSRKWYNLHKYDSILRKCDLIAINELGKEINLTKEFDLQPIYLRCFINKEEEGLVYVCRKL